MYRIAQTPLRSSRLMSLFHHANDLHHEGPADAGPFRLLELRAAQPQWCLIADSPYSRSTSKRPRQLAAPFILSRLRERKKFLAGVTVASQPTEPESPS